MKTNLKDPLDQLIEGYLETSSLWPQLKAIIRHAIQVEPDTANGFGSPRHWAPRLPAWCCEAVGGQAELTHVVSAAWKLFHIAAHILDNVADRDPPLQWWKQFGPGVAINTATALIFAAQTILNRHFEDPDRYPYAPAVIHEFSRSLEIVCSGQHVDLIQSQPRTDQWWSVATAKSGEPFALACKVGTIIGTEEPALIDAFARFGQRLGIIVQIQDDIHDFIHQDLDPAKKRSQLSTSSLPIAFALEVLPEEKKGQLLNLLGSTEYGPATREHIIELVEDTGAVVYIETKKEIFRKDALDELDRAVIDHQSRQLLSDLVEYLAAS